MNKRLLSGFVLSFSNVIVFFRNAMFDYIFNPWEKIKCIILQYLPNVQ